MDHNPLFGAKSPVAILVKEPPTKEPSIPPVQTNSTVRNSSINMPMNFAIGNFVFGALLLGIILINPSDSVVSAFILFVGFNIGAALVLVFTSIIVIRTLSFKSKTYRTFLFLLIMIGGSLATCNSVLFFSEDSKRDNQKISQSAAEGKLYADKMTVSLAKACSVKEVAAFRTKAQKALSGLEQLESGKDIVAKISAETLLEC